MPTETKKPRTRKLTPRHPLPDDCRKMLAALRFCSFLPGSFDKRFIRELAEYVQNVAPEITEKQEACLRKMACKYRRQTKQTWPDPAVPALNIKGKEITNGTENGQGNAADGTA